LVKKGIFVENNILVHTVNFNGDKKMFSDVGPKPQKKKNIERVWK